jgi:hypothetical protein
MSQNAQISFVVIITKLDTPRKDAIGMLIIGQR